MYLDYVDNAKIAIATEIKVEVSFSYNRLKPMSKDISLRSVSNETIVFVGASGSGKSTLLRLLSGLLPALEKHVFTGK